MSNLTITSGDNLQQLNTPAKLQAFMLENNLKKSIKAVAFIRAFASAFNLTADEDKMEIIFNDKERNHTIFTLEYLDFSFGGKAWLVSSDEHLEINLNDIPAILQTRADEELKVQEEAKKEKAEAEARKEADVNEFFTWIKANLEINPEMTKGDINYHNKYTDSDFYAIFKTANYTNCEEANKKFFNTDERRYNQDETMRGTRKLLLPLYSDIKYKLLTIDEKGILNRMFRRLEELSDTTTATNQINEWMQEFKETEIPETEIIE